MSQTESAPRSEQQSPRRSWAEWVTFGIAASILAGTVGLVGYTYFDDRQQQPPTIAILRTEAIREANGQFYVPFEIVNTGGETAESVQVLAELRLNGRVDETGEQQIDFLAGGEQEKGAFVFSRDPRQGDLKLRVASYRLP